MKNLSFKNSDKKIPHQTISVPTNKNENTNLNNNKTHKQIEIKNDKSSFPSGVNDNQKVMPLRLNSNSAIDNEKIDQQHNRCIKKQCFLMLGASLILVALPPSMAVLYEKVCFPNHSAANVYHDIGIVGFVAAGTIVGLVLLWRATGNKKLWCKLMINVIPEAIVLFIVELLLDKAFDDKEEK